MVINGHTGSVRAFRTLPNGNLVSTSSGFESNSCQIKIWNPNNGTLKHTSSGNTHCLWALVTLPNGDIGYNILIILNLMNTY
jgi:WD40 repeat protein